MDVPADQLVPMDSRGGGGDSPALRADLGGGGGYGGSDAIHPTQHSSPSHTPPPPQAQPPPTAAGIVSINVSDALPQDLHIPQPPLRPASSFAAPSAAEEAAVAGVLPPAVLLPQSPAMFPLGSVRVADPVNVVGDGTRLRSSGSVSGGFAGRVLVCVQLCGLGFMAGWEVAWSEWGSEVALLALLLAAFTSCSVVSLPLLLALGVGMMVRWVCGWAPVGGRS